MLLSSSRRPVTSRPLFRTATKRSRRLKNLPSSKKLPLKLNENGIVEKPAVPTVVAPGGGVRRRAPARRGGGRRRERACALTLIVRKSTLLRSAAELICTISERTSSSAGTALPSRATIE